MSPRGDLFNPWCKQSCSGPAGYDLNKAFLGDLNVFGVFDNFPFTLLLKVMSMSLCDIDKMSMFHQKEDISCVCVCVGISLSCKGTL